MNKIKFFVVIFAVALGLSGCKYEEGPFISFTPRQERVAGPWIAEKSIVDGTESVGLEGFNRMTMFKDGAMTMILELLGAEIAYSGNWVFGDKDETLLISLTDDATGLFSIEQTWEIIRLKEKELWVRYTDDNKTYEVNFATNE